MDYENLSYLTNNLNFIITLILWELVLTEPDHNQPSNNN